jgi:hypothetical protein
MFGRRKKNMEQNRSFQLGDHVVARDADHDFAIRGIIFDIDKEFYHVDWGNGVRSQFRLIGSKAYNLGGSFTVPVTRRPKPASRGS